MLPASEVTEVTHVLNHAQLSESLTEDSLSLYIHAHDRMGRDGKGGDGKGSSYPNVKRQSLLTQQREFADLTIDEDPR